MTIETDTPKTAANPAAVTLKVAVDTHVHEGKPCKKGDTIKVAAETAEMLEKSWKKGGEK